MALRISTLLFFSMIFCLLFQVGCTVSLGDHRGSIYTSQPSESAPPPWAPAHGQRAKYHYNYYPESNVYFDTGRGLYFYYGGDGWRASVSLPSEIRINVGDKVEIEMDSDRPYRYHDDVVKRYPPGQLKKMRKFKNKK